MADKGLATAGLAPSSAFMHWNPPAVPGLAVSARETLTVVGIGAAKGKRAELHAAVRNAFGIDLPQTPARVEANGVAFVWAGPDQWLAIAERSDDRNLEADVKAAAQGSGFVVDHSDGRVVIRIAGPRARDVLAKGVPLDLHPRAFRPGSAAITHASHIGVIVWQLNDEPAYEFAMFRSYVDSFVHWLFDSAAEYAA